MLKYNPELVEFPEVSKRGGDYSMTFRRKKSAYSVSIEADNYPTFCAGTYMYNPREHDVTERWQPTKYKGAILLEDNDAVNSMSRDALVYSALCHLVVTACIDQGTRIAILTGHAGHESMRLANTLNGTKGVFNHPKHGEGEISCAAHHTPYVQNYNSNNRVRVSTLVFSGDLMDPRCRDEDESDDDF